MLARKTWLRPVSKRKAPERALYAKEARAFVEAAREARQYCPVAVEALNQKLLPTEVHHVKGRGRFLRDQSTWMALSRAGHVWVHENVRLAKERGWIVFIP